MTRHLSGFRHVTVVGEDPGFSVEVFPQTSHLPCRDIYGPKAARIAHKFMVAMNRTDADRIVLWNDDYIVLKPYDVSSLGPHHRGILAERVRPKKRAPDAYQRMMLATGQALRAAGHTEFDYDSHWPMLVDRRAFMSLTAWWERSKAHHTGLLVKSVYGNVMKLGGERVGDAKVYGLKQFNEVRDRLWMVSLSDTASDVIAEVAKDYPAEMETFRWSGRTAAAVVRR
jgi:hypothetical protein